MTMTTFEITIIVLLVIIAIAVIYGMLILKQIISYNQMVMDENIRKMDAGLDKRFEDISQQLNNIENSNDQDFEKLTDIVDKMHRNLCVEIADKMVERTFPIKEGEPLDAAFEPDYKLKKDIECKLNGFAAAVLDAECCTKEIVDFWLERICDAAYKYIKQLKIDWDKLSKEQQDEFLKRLIMPNYDSPFQPPFNPTCETTNNNE